MRKVSAADANRQFSKILGEVKAGATVIVTSHGQPVARIEPAASQDVETVRREQAVLDLRQHLRSVQPLNVPITWKRDDVYEDDF